MATNSAREAGRESKYTTLTNPNIQASAILAVGSLLWKALSAWSNINFLLSIREEMFGVTFQFFESIGWIVLATVGAVWCFIAFHEKRTDASKWPLVLSCSIVAFLFGALVAVKSSGGVPNVIGAWSPGPNNCTVSIDTSKLVSFRDKYKVIAVCGIGDPTIEKLDDDRITVSNAFEIIPGAIQIQTPYSERMKQFGVAHGTNPFDVWFEAVIIPNDVQPGRIGRLRDVLGMNGKIIRPQYYR